MMYKIDNLNGFAKKLGKVVAKEIDISMKELKEYISVKSLKEIILEHSMPSEEGGKSIYIDADRTSAACEDIADWLIGVEHAKLAAEDLVECYWDNKINTMMFYLKEEDDA
tara:strand:- start:894 stop:1226 length:333 start_codon:yes stop_codon:yes gene_type:complete